MTLESTPSPSPSPPSPSITIYSRFLHRQAFGPYRVGRHGLYAGDYIWAPMGFIAKYHYTPWPEIRQRKLQIGIQHAGRAGELEQRIKEVRQWPQVDLRNVNAISEELAMIHRVWKDVIDQ